MAFWQRTAHAPRAQRHTPIWPFALAIGILATIAVVALLSTGTLNISFGSGAASAAPQQVENLPVASDPAPQADVQRPTRLTSAQKQALYNKVLNGNAAVVSTETMFARETQLGSQTSRQALKAFAKADTVRTGERFIESGASCGDPVILETMRAWRDNARIKSPGGAFVASALGVTTHEHMRGTNETRSLSGRKQAVFS
jgi:hypothetical protein